MSKSTGIRFEPGILEELDKIAKKEDRSRNKIINRACKLEIAKHKKSKKESSK
jgi:predicted transcriptional regulator